MFIYETRVPIMKRRKISIDLEALILFGKVVDARGVTNASIATGIPKATISRKISNLEKAIGVSLVARHTQITTPTAIGSKIHSFYEKIAREVASADEYIAGIQRGNQGILKVLVPSEIGVRWLAGVTSNFTQHHPEVELHINMTSARTALSDEQFDVALSYGRPSKPSLIAKKVATFQRGLFATPAYIQSYGVPRTPSDLTEHVCVFTNLQKADDVWTFYQGGQRRIIRSNRMVHVNNIHLVRRLILDGFGIGALTDIYYANDLRSRQLVRVLPDWKLSPLQLMAVTSTRSGLSMSARSFIDLLVNRVDHKE